MSPRGRPVSMPPSLSASGPISVTPRSSHPTDSSRRIQRRPWPEMTERVGALLDEFPGPAVHDATGAGSAIGEFPALEAHRQLQGVTMVGRVRTDLFRNYIAAIERDEIVCPRIDVFYTEHLYCGEDDLFGSGHPPDTVVAMALAYHAFKTGRQPGDYGVTL